MAYFNMNSLKFNADEYPKDESKIAQQQQAIEQGGKGVPILVNNNFEVIGNEEAYYVALNKGTKAIYGQKITLYEDKPVFPDRFSIEMSSECNFNCYMCPRTVLKREQGHMEEWLFRKVVDEIALHANVKMVDLYRLGESTCHPKFSELVGYIKHIQKFPPTILSSNGGVIDDSLLEFIMNSNITLFNLSVNAFDEETYRKVTGNKGDFEHTKHLLKTAKSVRKGNVPFFGIQFIEQSFTHGKVQHIIDEYIDYVDFIESSMLEDFGKQLSQNTEYIEEHYFDLNKEVKRSPCQRSIWGRFKVYSNGDVVPCICDINAEYLNMGNVKDNTIEEIFNSQQWKGFEEMHQNGSADNHPLCGPCTDWMIYTDYNKKHKVYLDRFRSKM